MMIIFEHDSREAAESFVADGYVIIDENDVVAVEKHDNAFSVEVSVDANVLVGFESIVKAGSGRAALPSEQERELVQETSSGELRCDGFVGVRVYDGRKRRSTQSILLPGVRGMRSNGTRLT